MAIWPRHGPKQVAREELVFRACNDGKSLAHAHLFRPWLTCRPQSPVDSNSEPDSTVQLDKDLAICAASFATHLTTSAHACLVSMLEFCHFIRNVQSHDFNPFRHIIKSRSGRYLPPPHECTALFAAQEGRTAIILAQRSSLQITEAQSRDGWQHWLG